MFIIVNVIAIVIIITVNNITVLVTTIITVIEQEIVISITMMQVNIKTMITFVIMIIIIKELIIAERQEVEIKLDLLKYTTKSIRHSIVKVISSNLNYLLMLQLQVQ